MLGHSGGAVGASSYLLMLPEERLVVALLCNMEDVSLEELALSLANCYRTSHSTLFERMKNWVTRSASV